VLPCAAAGARRLGAPAFGSTQKAAGGWDPLRFPSLTRAQLEAAITAAFKRLDKDIRAAVPDGTTAGVVILKRCRDGPIYQPLHVQQL
jgi:hypothetical protein